MYSKSDQLIRIINEDRSADEVNETPRRQLGATMSSSSSSSSPSPDYSTYSSYSSSSSSPSPQHLSLNRYKIDLSSKRTGSRRKRKLSAGSSASDFGDLICSLSNQQSLNSIRRVFLFVILVFLLIQLFNYMFYVSNRSSIFSMSYFKNIYEFKLDDHLERGGFYASTGDFKNTSVYENNLNSSLNVSAVLMAPRRGPYKKLVELVNLTAQEALTERELEHRRNDDALFDAFRAIKDSVAQVYEAADSPIDYCPNDGARIEGYLDSKAILARVNLTGLVTFYADSFAEEKAKREKEAAAKSKAKITDGLQRLGKKLVKSGRILRRKDFERLKRVLSTTPATPASTTSGEPTSSTTLDAKLLTDELFLLKTTNNFSLLNVSSSVFGYDGQRIQMGGYWRPHSCQSNFKLGVIIPYRDRLTHLKVLLNYLHLVLQRQMIEYRIFVVEPTTPLDIPFNKGRIMNSAYLEALKLNPDIDCFVFHDVDLVPEDDRNLYTCSQMPRHMSVAIDKFNYILPYSYLVGGVFNIRTDQYRRINGYSNMYWGWGGEDDDLAERIASEKLIIHRPPTKLARYKMMKHEGQKLNPNRHKHLKTAQKRYKSDGVGQVAYKLVSTTLYSGFTHFLVEVGLPDRK